jgi:hypothetical protein
MAFPSPFDGQGEGVAAADYEPATKRGYFGNSTVELCGTAVQTI